MAGVPNRLSRGKKNRVLSMLWLRRLVINVPFLLSRRKERDRISSDFYCILIILSHQVHSFGTLQRDVVRWRRTWIKTSPFPLSYTHHYVQLGFLGFALSNCKEEQSVWVASVIATHGVPESGTQQGLPIKAEKKSDWNSTKSLV